ncbi:pseudouridylate synthase 7 [Cyanidiococcus yangmingshanensis]|uniref:Pseudouridylate synthase 7 n=1 Tax=Cyanidiococcus yangmingshanensis TaxID=2690220 RepID=A0A7J7IEN7_9RHOD|nr:pseudouridylate synthase 7 [Cyanidiococcus yangmingshanensis]KAF6002883.1 pseudouridylate synthase 7 [Cyanidiococcus yangmingshanensis]
MFTTTHRAKLLELRRNWQSALRTKARRVRSRLLFLLMLAAVTLFGTGWRHWMLSVGLKGIVAEHHSPSASAGTTSGSTPGALAQRALPLQPWTAAELDELAMLWIGIEDALSVAHQVFLNQSAGDGNEEEKLVRGHAHAWRRFIQVVPQAPPSLPRAPRSPSIPTTTVTEEIIRLRRKAITSVVRGQKDMQASDPGETRRGIVIPAGGPRLFQMALVELQALRKLAKCQLPVEIFYRDASEAPSPAVEKWVTETFGPVVFRNVDQVRQRAQQMRKEQALAQMQIASKKSTTASTPRPPEEMPPLSPELRFEGYGMKVIPSVLSAFDELLVLDSDNIPLLNPTALFSLGRFGAGEIGGFFWIDYSGIFEFEGYRDTALYRTMLRQLEPPPCPSRSTNVGPFADPLVVYPESSSTSSSSTETKSYCGVAVSDRRGTESGQVLLRRRAVDGKRSFWLPLMLAVYMYHYRDFFYRHMLGDKDSFRLGGFAIGEPSELSPYALGGSGFRDNDGGAHCHAMLQFWPYELELFDSAVVSQTIANIETVRERHVRFGRTPLFMHRNLRKIPSEGVRLMREQPYNLQTTCWNNVSGSEARDAPRLSNPPPEFLIRFTNPTAICVDTKEFLGFDIDQLIVDYIDNLWDQREWRKYLYEQKIF